MHLSSRLPKKNYEISLNGNYNSEERRGAGGVNFKNGPHYHNTMGKKKNPKQDGFVVGYWKKSNGTDGTKMEDVKEIGDGRPAVFMVGHFQVSKCLDLAAQ